ncbi:MULTISPECIES: hypothetical protein [unclassified Veillonella]|uniref:hypothetical protein n=1 Tax=unclassified Veillonella TaxID=2630086 RepID=UPI00138963B9|nr:MULTISPECIES: hypothetical protein [unclassified Veillonella]KAF1682914.1 hypothetical protein VER_04360 [Veillonella sp. R32]
MKKKLLATVMAVSIATLSTGIFAGPAQAFSLGNFNLGSVLKVGGVGILVDRFGGQINDFLNKILSQNNLSTTYTTKVVPIVSVGNNGYIGAAQVTGPASEVERVEAVAQVEASFNSVARIKGLVPIDSKNPVNASRIQGVGVSAIIDIKI